MTPRHKFSIILGSGIVIEMAVMVTPKIVSGEITEATHIVLSYGSCVLAGIVAAVLAYYMVSEENIRKFFGRG